MSADQLPKRPTGSELRFPPTIKVSSQISSLHFSAANSVSYYGPTFPGAGGGMIFAGDKNGAIREESVTRYRAGNSDRRCHGSCCGQARRQSDRKCNYANERRGVAA